MIRETITIDQEICNGCGQCVPVAYAGFHSQLLRDHAVVIACPKLDDSAGQIDKLASIIRQNNLTEITVARMEVSCCGGILQAVLRARQLAGADVRVIDVVISIRGEVLARQEVPPPAEGSGHRDPAGCPSTRS
jgi:hypothetical protein